VAYKQFLCLQSKNQGSKEELSQADDSETEMIMAYYDYDDRGDDYDRDYDCDFAEPGGRSALRAASRSNPRNLPCPTCERPNVLTPRDRSLGYQCDRCADAMERGYDVGEY
jgi:hypothetical protein